MRILGGRGLLLLTEDDYDKYALVLQERGVSSLSERGIQMNNTPKPIE